MSNEIFALYLEQVTERISNAIGELKAIVPNEQRGNMLGVTQTAWPALDDLIGTRDSMNDAVDRLRGASV